MDFMTTTTPSPVREPRQAEHGLTLVELMVSMALAALLMAAVLSSFVFLGKEGRSIANYHEMETQARIGFERFAEDVRQAADLTWDSDTQVTLELDGGSVIYGYNNANKTFYRETGGVRTTVFEGVEAFSFNGYKVTGALVVFNAGDPTSRAQASKDTKQLQISLRTARTAVTVNKATNTVLSARFILRNKQVTT